MKIRLLQLTSPAIAAAIIVLCGYASAQSSTGGVQLISANATLVQEISSKNVSKGASVTARLSNTVKGATELPKGTLLLGNVVEVQASTGGNPAKLTIVFDQAQLRDGRRVPIKMTVVGAFPAASYDGDQDSSEPILPQTIAADESIDQQPGVLHNVALHSAVQSSDSAVFTSTDHNIDLKKGTQLQIGIAPQSGTEAKGQ